MYLPIPELFKIMLRSSMQGRQTRQNSGRVGEVYNLGQFLKKFHFLAFLRKTIKKDLLLDFLRSKKVYFLAFLRKAIKKVAFLRILTLKKV